MSNVLVFQPYLSNRVTSSGTVERQFRFLKNNKDLTVYALFDEEEKEYAEQLSKVGWITPIVKNLHENPGRIIEEIQEKYNFCAVFVARTYCTPCTDENKRTLDTLSWEPDDIKYWRNFVPIKLCQMGVHVHHMVYDPLELNYVGLLPRGKYSMWSSMKNVPCAMPHEFADLGYYDKGTEVDFEQKEHAFIFGGTSMSEERSQLLIEIRDKIAPIDKCNVFIRVPGINNLIPNEQYEKHASKALFTYTIPSQNPEYVSFTRMLLALAQGTIPLAHPGNKFDCLFGIEFPFRDGLKEFFDELIYDVNDLKKLLSQDYKELCMKYDELLDKWHKTEYYKWLQENA